MTLKKWFFTWGYGQRHNDRYTIIEAKSWAHARKIMFKVWGTKWCAQYNSAEDAGVERWGLEYIKTRITEKMKDGQKGGR